MLAKRSPSSQANCQEKYQSILSLRLEHCMQQSLKGGRKHSKHAYKKSSLLLSPLGCLSQCNTATQIVDGLAGSFGFVLTAVSWKELRDCSKYRLSSVYRSLRSAYRASDILTVVDIVRSRTTTPSYSRWCAMEPCPEYGGKVFAEESFDWDK